MLKRTNVNNKAGQNKHLKEAFMIKKAKCLLFIAKVKLQFL